jgi:endogenous inhibitor of DNA gyrase (YacG/DUF329 family)
MFRSEPSGRLTHNINLSVINRYSVVPGVNVNKNVKSDQFIVCAQCGKSFNPTKQNLKKAKFCSTKCKNIFGVEQWRIRTKFKAMDYKGGKCIKCGYDKYSEVLEFHHRDPSQKEFGIGHKGITRSWENLKKELDKCDLYCANCHRELHANLKIKIIE